MLISLLSSLSSPNHKTFYTKALSKYIYLRFNRMDGGKSITHHIESNLKFPLCIYPQSPFIDGISPRSFLFFFFLIPSSRKPLATHLPALSPLLNRIFFICPEPGPQQEHCLYPTGSLSEYLWQSKLLPTKEFSYQGQEDCVFSICYMSFIICVCWT